MKLFKRFKSKKGFTLTEVLVSIVIFALMSAIVMQILAIAIAQHRKNDSVDKDMDTQISNLVQDSTEADNDGRLEINTIDATIKNDGGNKDKDKNSGGMVTDDIHIYGTKGIDKIYVHEESCVLEDGKYKITLAFMVDTTSTNALNGSESKSLKIALPEASKNIVVTPDDKMVYSMVSGTNVRFSAKKASDKDTSYSMKIYFTLSEDKFESDYGCFAKYFVDPKSTDTAKTSESFDDAATNGIYNHIYGTPVKEDDAG